MSAEVHKYTAHSDKEATLIEKEAIRVLGMFYRWPGTNTVVVSHARLDNFNDLEEFVTDYDRFIVAASGV